VWMILNYIALPEPIAKVAKVLVLIVALVLVVYCLKPLLPAGVRIP